MSPEIYMAVFGGVAFGGIILGFVCQNWGFAIFCLIGLAVIGFWYYKMKVGK